LRLSLSGRTCDTRCFIDQILKGQALNLFARSPTIKMAKIILTFFVLVNLFLHKESTTRANHKQLRRYLIHQKTSKKDT
jgi:hypothetical protein